MTYDIVFINPPIPATDRGKFKGIYREECCVGLKKDGPILPSLLCWFCGIAEQKYKVALLDLQVSPYESIPQAKYYVVSASVYTLKEDLAITKELKNNFPSCRIAVVVQPPVLERWIKENYPVDYVIGQPRVQKFMQLFNLKKDAPSAYHLIELNKYTITPVYNGMGCPFDCIFCAWARTKHFYRDIDLAVNDALYVANESKSRMIYFIDPNTLLFPEWAVNFAKEIDNRFKWHIDARADRNEYKLLQELAKNGCTKITYGLETPELQKVHKGVKLEDILTAAKNCDEIGIYAYFTTLFGFPWDSWETQKLHKRFLEKILIYNSVTANVAFPVPHPNTVLYQMVKNRLPFSTIIDMYEKLRYRNEPAFPTDYLSIPELKRAYEDLYYFIHEKKVKILLNNFKLRYLRHIPKYIRTKISHFLSFRSK
ncbi:MAG: B12-binding domain-containing radical SAM protein [Candidatus Baldrarchaeia archaeon]